MSAQSNRVLDYYKNTRLDYRLLWTGRDTLAVHFGYYDAGVRNHAKSLQRMNEVLADAVQISKPQLVTPHEYLEVLHAR